jgi:hypothetical protein
MLRKNSKILEVVDNQVSREQRQDHIALEKFRLEHQKACDRRDFDLYDPDALKKDLPGRVGDFDPRNHVSGLQKFVGEDLHEQERKMQQKLQMMNWTQKQLEEKRQLHQKEHQEQK